MNIGYYRITTPNANFAGERHDILFKNGVGITTNDLQAQLCRNSGYTVEIIKPEEPEPAQEPEPEKKAKRKSS